MFKSFNWFRLKFIFTFLLFSTLLTNVQVVSATTNTDIDFNGRLTQGTNIYYWVSPGNEYTVSIPQAVSKLRYPSGLYNPIVLNKTSVQSQSKMDIYQYRSADGANAYQQSFRKNSSGSYYNCTGGMDKNG